MPRRSGVICESPAKTKSQAVPQPSVQFRQKCFLRIGHAVRSLPSNHLGKIGDLPCKDGVRIASRWVGSSSATTAEPERIRGLRVDASTL
jgi:hypothetical protein